MFLHDIIVIEHKAHAFAVARESAGALGEGGNEIAQRGVQEIGLNMLYGQQDPHARILVAGTGGEFETRVLETGPCHRVAFIGVRFRIIHPAKNFSTGGTIPVALILHVAC